MNHYEARTARDRLAHPLIAVCRQCGEAYGEHEIDGDMCGYGSRSFEPAPTATTDRERLHTMSMSLRNLILTSMEPTQPRDTIRDFWREHEGKEWTARREKPLREAIEKARPDLKGTVLFYTAIGGAHCVEWGGYTRTDGREGGHLRLTRWDWTTRSTDRTMAVAKLEEANPAAFRGADERNEQRRRALLDNKLMQRAETLLQQHNNIRGTLAHIEAELKTLMAYGEPLSADEYRIRRELMGERD